MKILHFSDSNGFRYRQESGEVISLFPTIKEEFDIVVCSGDFYPNLHWGSNRKKELVKQEIEYQNKWFISQLKPFKEFIQNKPFLWSSGNHDWAEPVSILNQNGIEAYDLDNKVIEFAGLSWAGFPYIPLINNNWNFEKDSNEMRQEVQKFLDRLKAANKFDSLDVLVCHCPPNGILDNDEGRGGHLGNSHMANALNYQFTNRPKLYLCGHVHEQAGKIEMLDEMIVSNAATTWNIIDLPA